jgi:hypothetical protein
MFSLNFSLRAAFALNLAGIILLSASSGKILNRVLNQSQTTNSVNEKEAGMENDGNCVGALPTTPVYTPIGSTFNS